MNKNENGSGNARHEWTPNEIVLTICAYHQIQRAPSQRRAIIDDLAKDFGCDPGAVAQAVDAVGGRRRRSKMAKLLLGCEPDNLLQNARWACREAAKIRTKMP